MQILRGSGWPPIKGIAWIGGKSVRASPARRGEVADADYCLTPSQDFANRLFTFALEKQRGSGIIDGRGHRLIAERPFLPGLGRAPFGRALRGALMTYSVLVGDCIASMRSLPDQSVNMCVTSPPYFGLRDYGHDGQIGLEVTPDAFVARIVEVFREVRRVLRDDGTLWLNLGDSYGSAGGNTYSGFNERWNGTGGAGSKQDATLQGVTDRKAETGLRPKNLLGIPWRVAFALQADGWYLRQDIIWHKPNPMPESVRDRCTKAHEYLFLLSKSDRYFFDADAIVEPFADDRMGASGVKKGVPEAYAKAATRGGDQGLAKFDGSGRKGRNRRSVWTVTTKPFAGAHFATFPPDLIEPCILAGCPAGGTVLDPFGGSGTTAGVAVKHGRKAILCELNPEYAALMPARIRAIAGDTPDMFMGAAE